MVDVEFYEQQDTRGSSGSSGPVFKQVQSGVPSSGIFLNKRRTMADIVISLGLSKTRRGALFVLVLVASICVALSIYLLFVGGVFGKTERVPAIPSPMIVYSN